MKLCWLSVPTLSLTNLTPQLDPPGKQTQDIVKKKFLLEQEWEDSLIPQ